MATDLHLHFFCRASESSPETPLPSLKRTPSTERRKVVICQVRKTREEIETNLAVIDEEEETIALINDEIKYLLLNLKAFIFTRDL